MKAPPDLLALPRDQLRCLADEGLPGVRAYRTQREVFGVRRDLDDVGHPQVPRPVKPWPDRWAHCPKLLSVHLRYQPTQACRDGRREPVDSVPCRCLLTVRIRSTAVSACLPAHRI